MFGLRYTFTFTYISFHSCALQYIRANQFKSLISCVQPAYALLSEPQMSHLLLDYKSQLLSIHHSDIWVGSFVSTVCHSSISDATHFDTAHHLSSVHEQHKKWAMFPSSGGNRSECDHLVDMSTHKNNYKTSCKTL